MQRPPEPLPIAARATHEHLRRNDVMRLDPIAAAHFLELVHACADGCDSPDAFRSLVRRFVTPLLPHRFSIAVLGTLSFDQLAMDRVIGIDYPEPYLAMIPQHLNIRERPVVAKWLSEREPIVIDIERDHTWISELERREIEMFGLGRLAIHGQIDLSSQMGSYFSFAGVDPSVTEAELRYRLGLIAPHVHAAFVSVPAAMTGVQVAAALSNIEHELLVWLASGRTNADIATVRGRSPATIRNQLHALYTKLQVGSRAEAVAVASRLLGRPSASKHRTNDL